jgi:Negative regulator of beta-lactamase expression
MAERKKTNLIIIHCSATCPSMDWGAAEIDELHRKQGYLSGGYHYVIRRNGVVEPGRYRDDVGAHARGYNERSVGVCLIGGVTEKDVNKAENNFTPEQFASLKKLVTDLLTVYPGCEVIGHRDVAKKACPSFDAKAWWAEQ